MKNSKMSIDLIEPVITKGDLNQAVETTRITSTIIAQVDSVSQTEFFSGGKIGLKPQLRATVYDFEYNDEPIVRVNGKLYKIKYVIGILILSCLILVLLTGCLLICFSL